MVMIELKNFLSSIDCTYVSERCHKSKVIAYHFTQSLPDFFRYSVFKSPIIGFIIIPLLRGLSLPYPVGAIWLLWSRCIEIPNH